MVRNDLLGKRFLLNDVIDYDNFITAGEMYNLRWLDGHIMDSEVTDIFRKNTFPFVLEVDENGYVSFDKHLAKSVSFKHFMHVDPKGIEMPLTLLVNQKNPGITVTLDDGREFVYDIKDALENNYAFHSWLKSVTKPPIQVGDIVRIADCGQLYTTYLSWFKENKVDIDIAARYAYANEVNPPMNVDYEIVAVGKHLNNGATLYAIAQKSEVIYGGNPVYLISGRGVRRA